MPEVDYAPAPFLEDEEEQRRRARMGYAAVPAGYGTPPIVSTGGESPYAPAPMGKMAAHPAFAPVPASSAEAPEMRPSEPSPSAYQPAPLSAITAKGVSAVSPGDPSGSAYNRYSALSAQGPPELHGWKKGLDIAGQVLAPRLEQAIPGTPGHYRGELEQSRRGAVTEAGLADTQAQMRQREALAQKALNPPAPRSEGKTVETGEGVFEFNEDTGRYDIRIGGPKSHTTPEAEKPIGASVATINRQLADRWNVLNPGKPVPEQYVLGKDATNADYNRAHANLQSLENAVGAKGAREDAAKQREQFHNETMADRKVKAEEAGRQFHPAIAQQVVQGMTTQASTRRLLDILAPYKDDNAPFGSFMKTLEYRIGKAQVDEIGKELASINLTGLQQAGSVLKGMGGVRSVKVLDKVLQHTPDPMHDSVKNMYDKMINIDRATALFLEDADKYGRKSAAELPPESMKPYEPKGGGVQGKGPAEGTVEGGYRFKGGDPADKANWEKVKQ